MALGSAKTANAKNLNPMGLFRLLFKRTQQELALRLLHEGKSVSAVARAFNVHQATIYRCIKPKTSL